MPRPTLTEAAALLLISLADGPRDVRELAEQLSVLPGDHTLLSTSRLYGFLDRLHNRGLVQVVGEEQVHGRVHRRFRLTETGREALRCESARWRSLAAEAEERLARGRSGD